jgi:hypothetical protein
MTTDAVDWTNPCARAAALRNAYYALMTGARETEIRTRTLDAEDFVRFQTVDAGKLQIELQAAERECDRLCGKPDPNRRFAITAGNRSDIPRFNRMRRPL